MHLNEKTENERRRMWFLGITFLWWGIGVDMAFVYGPAGEGKFGSM